MQDAHRDEDHTTAEREIVAKYLAWNFQHRDVAV